MIWERLETVQLFIETAINDSIGTEETFEPGMDRFHNDQWTNRTWQGLGFRRAHLDVVDARETKGLWMMHVCIMPHLSNDAPIYGFDVIAGRNKITGAFLDYSPGVNSQHLMLSIFERMVGDLKWKKERELPDWAKAIFSENMVAAGNVTDEFEVEQIIAAVKHTLWFYLDNIASYNNRASDLMTAKVQNHYATHQRMNPHTPKVMKSLGLPEADVDLFIDKCLFPEIDLENLRA